jgi:subtilisin family serine protease
MPRAKSDRQLTVVYVHGVSRQMREDRLRAAWDKALFGYELGDQSRFAYWSDLRFWDKQPVEAEEGVASRRRAKRRLSSPRVTIQDNGGSGEALDFEDRIYEMQMELAADLERELAADVGSVSGKWIPDFLEEPLLGLFAEDAKHYLFDSQVRGAVRERLAECLEDPNGRYLIVAHSLGTVIAYDELWSEAYANRNPSSITLLTIGSPLGQEDIFARVHKLIGRDNFLAMPPCVGRWHNFYSRYDPVTMGYSALARIAEVEADGRIATSDRVVTSQSLNPFVHHYALNYLASPDVRRTAREAARTPIGPLGAFRVAADVNRDFDRQRGARQAVLIELDEYGGQGTLDAARIEVIERIERVVGERREAAQIEGLKRFVAARLTRREVDRLLRQEGDELVFGRIWKNAKKRANQGSQAAPASVLQVKPANLGYQADGSGIGWAVLDTGIRADHPHFATHGTIAGMWDCTAFGPIQKGNHNRVDGNLSREPGIDRDGHGTHVAAIIAGHCSNADVSMAPKAKIFSYKVLGDDGSGEDAYIIKALDHIAELNAGRTRPAIHGINLSLGGPFDADVFGTGHSPICREIRRLIKSGTVVCIAAGNEGAMKVMTNEGYQDLQYDLSIGDPANLEDAIAVGSVHSTMPEKFGISNFSSRGPTADGRAKPDIVAPGEWVLSANSSFYVNGQDKYVRMSGTSMACPHISGLIAAFLSVRGGYVGYPERVKQILMETALDLKRDRYFQGAGLPNLIKMLLATA